MPVKVDGRRERLTLLDETLKGSEGRWERAGEAAGEERRREDRAICKTLPSELCGCENPRLTSNGEKRGRDASAQLDEKRGAWKCEK